MIIGIDLDGVVFNSEMFFMASAEIYDSKVLKRNSIVKKDEPRVQNKYNWSDSELQGYIRNYANSECFDVMPCAKEVIDALKADNSVFFISARGQFNKEEVELARRKLESADIFADKYFFGNLDKEQIVLSQKVDVMIDDRYDVCDTLSKKGVLCLYFRMAGRKVLEQNDCLVEINNWGEAYRALKDRGVIK